MPPHPTNASFPPRPAGLRTARGFTSHPPFRPPAKGANPGCWAESRSSPGLAAGLAGGASAGDSEGSAEPGGGRKGAGQGAGLNRAGEPERHQGGGRRGAAPGLPAPAGAVTPPSLLKTLPLKWGQFFNSKAPANFFSC